MSKIYYNNKLKQKSRELRNNSTLAEELLWSELKGKKLMGYRFSRQRPIGNYIVDFFCHRLNLIIEIDGESHIGRDAEDCSRQSELEKRGYSVIRFSDLDVKSGMEGVVQVILQWIMDEEASIREKEQPPVSPFTKGD